MMTKYLPAFALAGTLFIPQQRPSAPQGAVVVSAEIGAKLPEFSVDDLHGRPVRSGDLHGKVVLVDFWATWCGPCKKEMPGYQRLLDHYGSQGLVVIGFKFDTMQDTEAPISFARRLGVRYPLAVASDEIKNKFGGIEGLPTTLLYDQQGVLRYKVVGFEYTEEVEKEVKGLCKGSTQGEKALAGAFTGNPSVGNPGSESPQTSMRNGERRTQNSR